MDVPLRFRFILHFSLYLFLSVMFSLKIKWIKHKTHMNQYLYPYICCSSAVAINVPDPAQCWLPCETKEPSRRKTNVFYAATFKNLFLFLFFLCALMKSQMIWERPVWLPPPLPPPIILVIRLNVSTVIGDECALQSPRSMNSIDLARMNGWAVGLHAELHAVNVRA